jgi:glycosyltransferase involved in cell wall biosynthesis
MKVLHILSDIDYSGAEVMLYTAEKYFKKAGIKTHALSTGTPDLGIGPFAEKMEEIGVRVYFQPFKKNLKHFLSIRKLIAKEKFDVIHLHKEEAFIWTALSCWFPFRHTKMVRTIHNNFVYTGYRKIRRKIHHWVAQNFLGVRFITISREVMENESRLYHTRSVLINNWTDTERFNMTEAPENDAKKRAHTFVSVGECTKVKNHQAIIGLVKKLKDRGVKFHYIHLGKGPLEQAEMAYAKELGVEDQVTFIGYNIKVDRYLSFGDYYIMPSQFEGLSISCAEAMSSGKVCIVNDAPGLRTMVRNQETGFVVDFSDLDKVADILLKIYQDPQLKQSLAENARKYIVENFSLKNIQKQIEVYA